MSTTHDLDGPCSRIGELVSEYLDGELDAGMCANVEAHLRTCEECESLVETLRHTIRLSHRYGQTPMPADLPRRLTRALEIAAAIRGRAHTP